MNKLFKKAGKEENNVGWALSLRNLPITLRRVGLIGKRSIKNLQCHPELAAPLVADVKEAYKGGCSQSISGSSHRQKGVTICTVSGKEVLDKVGWAFSPTLKYCWGRNPNLHKNCNDLMGKKSINSSPCHPELVSGSCHLQEYTDFNVNKSNVCQVCPTNKMPRRAAFTLAEVLITLGIIGVVAAMTLPALLANQRKIEYSSRLKKFNSTMSQAILMAQKDYGEPKYWTKTPNNILKDDNGNPILDDNGKSSMIEMQAVKILWHS